MREECLKCGLYSTCKTPQLEGDGSKHPKILFIGEAPGREEDRDGVPFVGKSGKILRTAIEALGLDDDEWRVTNVVRCRPPGNRTPKAGEVKYCADLLLQEIEETKPSVLVLLGNTPLKAVLGEHGITDWNGVVAEHNGYIVIPAFHPSFFNYGNMEKFSSWIDALRTAAAAARGKIDIRKDEDVRYVFPRSEEELDAMVQLVHETEGYVSYDVETSYVQPVSNNKMLSVSIGVAGVAFAFPIEHPETAEWYGSKTTAKYARTCVARILEAHDIIGHNVRFDCKQTNALLGIDFVPWGDTMLMSQLIDSKPGIHGLKRLAGVYLGMYNYDQELVDYCAEHPEASYKKGGSYENVPLDTLLPYGAKDAAATYLLYAILEAKLTDAQANFYSEVIVPVDYELGRLEANGFKLDKHIATRYKHLYTRAAERYYNAMLEDPEVQEFIADELATLEVEFAKRQAKSKRELKRPEFTFNPASSAQMRKVLYSYKGHRPLEKTATGLPSVAKTVLAASSVKDDPIFENYRRWSLMTSMLSKYLRKASEGVWDYGTGRVHANFNIGGASTGRLSSSSPNLQNIPTPEKEPGTLLAQLPIKNIFTHTFEGGYLVSVDYSGMELRIMASVANCKGMIEVFQEGGDLHKYVTSQIYNIPIEEVTKVQRYRGKWVNWTLLYGGDAHTLHKIYNVDMKEAEYIVKAYYKRFPEVLKYQKSTQKFAMEHGYVESKVGRRLYLAYLDDADRSKVADSMRTAINMPIQSLASDVLLCAIIILAARMREKGMRTMLVNTVHDSIVADVPPEEIHQFISLTIDVMENLVSYSSTYFPSLDFSWLRVPLVADADYGTHYGSMKEYSVPY